MRRDTLPALNTAIEKLTRSLFEKREQLQRIEASIGRGWNPQRANRLREEIARIEQRLSRAERLQDKT